MEKSILCNNRKSSTLKELELLSVSLQYDQDIVTHFQE